MKEMRLQQVNDDTVLEVTEEVVTVKTRHSLKKLLEKKRYLEEAIASFQNELIEVNKKLDMIYEAKAEQNKK